MKSLAIAIAVGIAALYSIVAVRFCVRAWLWLPPHKRWKRASNGLCPKCGYDLTANVSGICPECGAKIAQEIVANTKAPVVPSLVTDQQPQWVWVVVVATMSLAVVLARWLGA